jgi:hypothetical protein
MTLKNNLKLQITVRKGKKYALALKVLSSEIDPIEIRLI